MKFNKIKGVKTLLFGVLSVLLTLPLTFGLIQNKQSNIIKNTQNNTINSNTFQNLSTQIIEITPISVTTTSFSFNFTPTFESTIDGYVFWSIENVPGLSNWTLIEYDRISSISYSHTIENLPSNREMILSLRIDAIASSVTKESFKTLPRAAIFEDFWIENVGYNYVYIVFQYNPYDLGNFFIEYKLNGQSWIHLEDYVKRYGDFYFFEIHNLEQFTDYEITMRADRDKEIKKPFSTNFYGAEIKDLKLLEVTHDRAYLSYELYRNTGHGNIDYSFDKFTWYKPFYPNLEDGINEFETIQLQSWTEYTLYLRVDKNNSSILQTSFKTKPKESTLDSFVNESVTSSSAVFSYYFGYNNSINTIVQYSILDANLGVVHPWVNVNNNHTKDGTYYFEVFSLSSNTEFTISLKVIESSSIYGVSFKTNQLPSVVDEVWVENTYLTSTDVNYRFRSNDIYEHVRYSIDGSRTWVDLEVQPNETGYFSFNIDNLEVDQLYEIVLETNSSSSKTSFKTKSSKDLYSIKNALLLEENIISENKSDNIKVTFQNKDHKSNLHYRIKAQNNPSLLTDWKNTDIILIPNVFDEIDLYLEEIDLLYGESFTIDFKITDVYSQHHNIFSFDFFSENNIPPLGGSTSISFVYLLMVLLFFIIIFSFVIFSFIKNKKMKGSND